MRQSVQILTKTSFWYIIYIANRILFDPLFSCLFRKDLDRILKKESVAQLKTELCEDDVAEMRRLQNQYLRNEGLVFIIELRLKELRLKNLYTIKEIAGVLGCTASLVSRYENGSRMPRADYLVKLADFYDVSVDYLLGLTEDKERH